MPREEFYVDEGVNGMHLIAIEQSGPFRSDMVTTMVTTRVSFKDQRVIEIAHKQSVSGRRLFELLLRSIGYYELSSSRFSRAVIIDKVARNVMLYKPP